MTSNVLVAYTHELGFDTICISVAYVAVELLQKRYDAMIITV